MSFSVYWEADARTSLAQIWLDAPDRRSVTEAQAAIDQFLASVPKSGAYIRRASGRLTSTHSERCMRFTKLSEPYS